MAIYPCLLRISNNLAWNSASEMLSRQGFQLPKSLRIYFNSRAVCSIVFGSIVPVMLF